MGMQSMGGSAAGLGGHWTHSFEEDGAGLRVYRPTATFAFPPSRRGRESLEFTGQGAVMQGAPGPDDRPRVVPADWTALGMGRYQVGGGGDLAGHVVEVLESSAEILRLRVL